MIRKFRNFLGELKSDSELTTQTKLIMLKEWKGKIIRLNTGRLMTTAMLEDHIEMLSILDETIKEYENE